MKQIQKISLYSVLSAFLWQGLFVSAQASVDDGISFMYQGKPKEALEELSKYIKSKDPRAAFYSAIIYLFEDDVDSKKGLELLERAVRQGYPPAIGTYAGLYLHGEVVPQDRHKALMYYEISAQQGYGPSQFNCGILYKNGEKIPKDLVKAFVYLTMAAHNSKDLDELTIDATEYRDQVIKEMTSKQYQEALLTFAQLKKYTESD